MLLPAQYPPFPLSPMDCQQVFIFTNGVESSNEKPYLHFSADQTAWKFILPALLDLPSFSFDWGAGDFLPPNNLLKSRASYFCPIGIRSSGAVTDWLEQYSPEFLASKIDLTFWGEPFLDFPCRPLVPLLPAINGFFLDIQSRHPEHSFRSLLNSRGLLHPIKREQLRVYLIGLAQQLHLDIQPLSTAPPFGFDLQTYGSQLSS
jgi:hypothetical protein